MTENLAWIVLLLPLASAVLIALFTIEQIVNGNRSIIGLMLESNLLPGNQPLTEDPTQLKYGLSITDGCIGWEESRKLLGVLADAVGQRRLKAQESE